MPLDYNEENPMPTEMIRQINDTLRTTMFTTKTRRVVMTPMVAHAPEREEILTAVRNFKGFDKENDPNKEHDFGKVVVDDDTYFFKFTYFDKNLDFFGYDVFVLTIMHASEY